MSQPGPSLVFRRATARDVAAVRALLARLRVPVMGSHSGLAQRALVRASLSDKRVVLLVAECGTDLVGIGLAVIHPRQFWPSLLLRNPWLFAVRAGAMVQRKLRGRTVATSPEPHLEDVRSYLSPSSGRHWGESSPQIAHVLIVTLLPEYRGGGNGSRFFAAVLDELARVGMTRFDSRIARGNLASVKMCHRMGIHVEDAPGTLFVTQDLPWSQP